MLIVVFKNIHFPEVKMELEETLRSNEHLNLGMLRF